MASRLTSVKWNLKKGTLELPSSLTCNRLLINSSEKADAISKKLCSATTFHASDQPRPLKSAAKRPYNQQDGIPLHPLPMKNVDQVYFDEEINVGEDDESRTMDTTESVELFDTTSTYTGDRGLIGIKIEIIQIMATSMVDPKDFNNPSVRSRLKFLVEKCAHDDPEFILKAALYGRRELNLRTAPNLLLSLAFTLEACRPYTSKYFSAIVRLPSDWMSVVEMYKTTSGQLNHNSSLPKILRRNLTTKFAEFDSYQLAKYNRNKRAGKRESQVKHSSKRSKAACTLKHLIRYLHIRSPPLHVMCLLGKPYPTGPHEFIQAGLEGDWDPSFVGKRMKLPQPETWETILSSEGNNAHSWESLILSGKLPYMAILRNIRNIIKSGVSPKLHDTVLQKLTNQRAVTTSKQLPFRFFSAYTVLEQMERKYDYNKYLCRIASKVKRFSQRKLSAKVKAAASNVKPCIYDDEILLKYRKAIGTAIEISARNNVPSIRGSVLILCMVPKRGTKGLQESCLHKHPRSVGVLLGLMCASASENCCMFVSHEIPTQLVALGEYTTNMKSDGDQTLLSVAQKVCSATEPTNSINLEELLVSLCSARQRFDTVFVLGTMDLAILEYVRFCRQYLGPVTAVWSDLTGKSSWPGDAASKSDWFTVKGNTDMVLRYIAEASNTGLLAQIDRIAEAYDLRDPPFTIDKQALCSVLHNSLQVERPLSEWRCCRVFVSSTFRDMFAERDLICGVLLPSIRQFAARELHVHVNEIDLRWGVPESITRTPQALQLCFEQVIKADLFLLLVGERYGWVPKSSIVSGLPPHIQKYLKSFYKPGMSVTEMEYRLMKQLLSAKISGRSKRFGGKEQDYLSRRILTFLRDSSAINTVPSAHLAEFSEQKSNKRERLESFKRMIRSDGVVCHDNYPAFYNGVAGGRHVMGNLTEVGKSLYRSLREALYNLYAQQGRIPLEEQELDLPVHATHEEFITIFVDPVASAIAPRQLLELERSFMDLKSRGKHCRALRKSAEQRISGVEGSALSAQGHDGAVLLITGPAGCGKTTHIAALTTSLYRPGWIPAQYQTEPQRAQSGPQDLLRREKFSFLDSGASAITQRPKLPPSMLFVHFTDGLPLTGLPPKYALAGLISDWNRRMIETIQRVLPSSRKIIDRIISSSDVDSSLNGGGDSVATQYLRGEISQFHSLIQLLSHLPQMQFVFLIDGCELLKPTSLEWLPDVLPHNVRFVVTCDPSTTVAREIANRPDCLAFTIRGLSYPERAAAIRALFNRYGKILDESGCNNQVSVLVNKRGAELPFYLRLACDELRLHATYEQLDLQLRSLPLTVPTLIRHIVARTELDCGSELTRVTLGLISCSQQPLSAPELRELLDCYLSVDGPLLSFDQRGWLQLENLPDTGNESSLIISECVVQALLRSASKVADTKNSKKKHLPPLVFEFLINKIRPLLAGFGDEAEELDTSPDLDLSTDLVSELAIIRFRSQEIQNIVQDIVFNQTAGIPPSAVVGYHPISSPRYGMVKVTRREHQTLCQKHVSRYDIHWLLATTGDRLEYLVYHFFHAGKMDIVCRLLTSGVFMIAKFRAGFVQSILDDFHGYGTEDPTLQAQWSAATQVTPMKDHLSSMRRFLATNCSMLIKYPFLLPQLALNASGNAWIRKVGFALSEVFKPDFQRQRMRLLIAHDDAGSKLWDTPIEPEGILDLKGHSAICGQAPTAVALDPTGRLLACGLEGGNLLILDVRTFRVLNTLFGVGSCVLSCCFISLENSKTLNSALDLCVVSTARDGAVSLWELNTGTTSTGHLQVSTGARFLSLGDCHVSASTCVCWHPGRRILATGGLDCRVYLWMLPKSIKKLQQDQFQSTKSKVPVKCIRTGSARVSCVAVLRQSVDYSFALDELPDIIAVGCWDGTVRIHMLDNLVLLKLLKVSDWALSSLDFSPIDGVYFVTRDIKDRVTLWKTESYALISVIQRGTNRSTDGQSIWPQHAICNHGRACFSRPDGRFIISSSGYNDKVERIDIWSSQPGAALGPWMNCGVQNVVQRRVTAFGTDPLGHFAVSATDDGYLILACSLTGRTVRTHSIDPSSSRVQAIACDISYRDNLTDPYLLLIALGFSTGYIHIYSCAVQCNGSLENHLCGGMSECSTTPLQLREKSGYHSENLSEHAISPSGGVYCMSAANMMVVSGGGNASCGFYFCDDSASVKEKFKVKDFDAGVTAVHVGSSFILVGCKDRLVCVYQYNREGAKFVTFCRLTFAADDWITALSIIRSAGSAKSDTRGPTILVGSNDHAVRVYRIDDVSDYRLLQTLDGPGGAITSLHSSNQYFAAGSHNGLVKVWKLTLSEKSEYLTAMDLNIGLGIPPGSSPVVHVKLFNTTDLQRVQVSTRGALTAPVDDRPETTEEVQDESTHTSMDHSDDESMASKSTQSKGSSSEPAECLPGPQDIRSSDSGFEIESPATSSVSEATDSKYLSEFRMLIAQRHPASSGGVNDVVDSFRYRVFVPLLPQRRAILRGHVGAMATQFASSCHLTEGSDALLVSVAEPSYGLTTYGGDLRSWCLPLKDSNYRPEIVTHHGAVTCSTPLDLDRPSSHYLSGGADGTLILWNVPHCNPSTTGSSGWRAMVKFDFGTTLPITAVRSVQSPRKAVVVVTYGQDLVTFTLSPEHLEFFASNQLVEMQQLSCQNHPLHGKLEFHKISLERTIVDICTLKKDQTMYVVVAELGGVYSVVRVANHSASSGLNLKCIKPSGSPYPGACQKNCDLLFACFGDEYPPLGIYNKQAFVFHPGDDSVRLEKYQLFDSFLSDYDQVDILSTVVSDQNRSETCYLARTILGNVMRLQVLTRFGSVIAQSEAYVHPNVITAICVDKGIDNPRVSVIVLATSDGLLHVLRYTSEPGEAGQFQKIGLCPTGEHVTSLLMLRGPGILQVAAGFFTGSTKLYAIT